MTGHEPWDDERLDAAWSARSARAATPSDLPDVVISRLRSPRRGAAPTWRLLLPIAAVIAVAVVLVRPSPLATPIASSPSTIQPTTSPTVATASPPAGLGQLPVMTVAQLIDRSGHDPSAEEVVVRGWIRSSMALFDCSRRPFPDHPLIPSCQGADNLTDRPIGFGDDPTSNGIVPILGPDAHIEAPRLGSPIEVLAVGHQRDHRWTTCPSEQQATCKARFVIDRLLPIDAIADAPLEPWSIVDGETDPEMRLTSEDVIARVEAAVGLVRVISIGYVWPGSQIRDIEPTAVANPAVTEFPIRPVWLVRALTDESRGALRTFAVSDVQPPEPGNSGISEITETSVIALDDEIRTMTIDLWNVRGLAAKPDVVTIIDHSGLVVSVRRPSEAAAAAISREASRSGGSQTLRLRDPGLPGSLYLAWDGLMCDESTVTIYPDATALGIDRGPTQLCQLALVFRIVRVDFSDPAVPERLATSTLPPLATLPPSAAP